MAHLLASTWLSPLFTAGNFPCGGVTPSPRHQGLGVEIAQLGAFSSQDTSQPTSIVCRVDAESTVNIQRKGGAFPAGNSGSSQTPQHLPICPDFLTCPLPSHLPLTFSSAPHFPTLPYLFTWLPPSHPSPTFPPTPLCLTYPSTFLPAPHLSTLSHLLIWPPPSHTSPTFPPARTFPPSHLPTCPHLLTCPPMPTLQPPQPRGGSGCFWQV